MKSAQSLTPLGYVGWGHSTQLGYSLDSRYYGIPDSNAYMRNQLSKLTLEEVNRAIRRYLRTDRMRIVVVTKDAKGFRDALVKNLPSPITYNSPEPKEIMDEDSVIQVYRINVKAEDVVVVPVERVFE